MSGLDDAQLDVARIRFGLPEARGFALAGGSALLALGAIERPTRDIDAFVAAKPETPPGDVGPLLAALRRRLVAEGWTVTVDREQVTFARLLAERADGAVEIDLAVDSPPLFALEVVPICRSSRVRTSLPARCSRSSIAPRDATSPICRRSQLGTRAPSASGGAQELDAGVRRSDLAEAFAKLERLDDIELPCPPEACPALRVWYEHWAADLIGGT